MKMQRISEPPVSHSIGSPCAISACLPLRLRGGAWVFSSLFCSFMGSYNSNARLRKRKRTSSAAVLMTNVMTNSVSAARKRTR